jgi:hypothetical protein
MYSPSYNLLSPQSCKELLKNKNKNVAFTEVYQVCGIILYVVLVQQRVVVLSIGQIFSQTSTLGDNL